MLAFALSPPFFAFLNANLDALQRSTFVAAIAYSHPNENIDNTKKDAVNNTLICFICMLRTIFDLDILDRHMASMKG